MILWRGAPGWYAKGERSGSSGGGGKGAWHHRFYQAGLEFEMSLDFASRIAVVQGKEVPLHDANIILVDHVDSPNGPQVVGVIKVDGTIAEDVGFYRGPYRIIPALGRSKQVRDFLRCDTALPDPRMQERIAPICLAIMSQ
jgi:hypothetical protein